MRDHNYFINDQGGIEFLSEADYSVYQEYGTSRMAAQPWFETSIANGLSEAETIAEDIYSSHVELEELLLTAIDILETAEDSIMVTMAIGYLEEAISLAQTINYPTREIEALLQEALFLEEEFIEMEAEEEEEEMGRGSGGGGGRGAAHSMVGAIQQVWSGFAHGEIGLGDAAGLTALALGVSLFIGIAAVAINSFFAEQRAEYAARDATKSKQNGLKLSMGGFMSLFYDDRDTTHHPTGG